MLNCNMQVWKHSQCQGRSSAQGALTATPGACRNASQTSGL